METSITKLSSKSDPRVRAPQGTTLDNTEGAPTLGCLLAPPAAVCTCSSGVDPDARRQWPNGPHVLRNTEWPDTRLVVPLGHSNSISGLVVEYIVAIDVTRVRFPADAPIPRNFRRPRARTTSNTTRRRRTWPRILAPPHYQSCARAQARRPVLTNRPLVLRLPKSSHYANVPPEPATPRRLGCSTERARIGSTHRPQWTAPHTCATKGRLHCPNLSRPESPPHHTTTQ